MKKLTTLALAAGLIVAAAAPASAVDTKVSGNYVFSFQRSETGFKGQDLEFARQRLQLGLTFTVSENLSAYVEFESSDAWKTVNNKPDLYTRLAYMDWVIPGTSAKVRMGKFEHGIPAEPLAGNTVMGPGAERTGIQVTTPVADWMSLTAQWSRVASSQADGDSKGVDVSAGDNADIFSVFANMKFDGVSVTPWAVAMFNQNGSKTEIRGADQYNANDSQAYWGGVIGTLTMFDPLTVKAAAAIGTRDYKDGYDRTGWYAMATASYKLAFGTPTFGVWYGSGDDKDADYVFQDWAPTTGNGKMGVTTTYYDNVFGLAKGQANGNVQGTWGIKLGLDGVSFLDGLTHDFAVAMINGTNHDKWAAQGKAAQGNYLTWSDTVYEFDFGTTYKIYKNLTAKLELAYVLNDLDLAADAENDENDWRAALTFKYAF